MVNINENGSIYVSIKFKNETDKKSSLYVSSSLKNETYTHKYSLFLVSSSFKNETYTSSIESSILLNIVLEPSFHPPVLVGPFSSSISSEHIPISIQESNHVQKKSRQMK
jgi:hypothetical protein